FHWLSRRSDDDGQSSQLMAEFHLRRRTQSQQARENAEPQSNAAPQRAFDFWIGEWSVLSPTSGEPLGESTISEILGGNAIHEHWRGADGSEGQSLNAYDARRGVWHQSWVSRDGNVLLLDGVAKGDAIDLRGSNEQGVQERIRWTPHNDGCVTQLWESSYDGGVTWKTRFEGFYTPKLPR